MTRNGLGPVGLDKLEAALDTYGADRTRWPAPLRLALSGLIAGSAEARKALRDAEAFDRLLDDAPQYDATRLARLKDRIVAATERQPRLVATRSATGESRSGVAVARPSRLRHHHGLAATALAASLVLGMFAGQTTVLNNAADSLLGNSSLVKDSRQLAQTDDVDNLLDGNLL